MNQTTLKDFFLTELHIENLRGFKSLKLNLQDGDGSPRKRTVIIGRNGTCKTSLLRAIVFGMSSNRDANSLLNLPNGSYVGPFVSDPQKKEEAKIDCKITSPSQNRDAEFSTRISSTQIATKSGKQDTEEVWITADTNENLTNFIVAYGTARQRIGTDSGRDYRIYDSVQTLFNNDAFLLDTELTLRRLSDYLGETRYDQALRGIKRVLNLPEDTQIDLAKGGGIRVLDGNESIPLEGWADGYKLTFQWIIDLYAWAIRANTLTEDGGITGLLLIDELEQHLHPSLQSTTLNTLSELFPDLQIIATTHSPMVALGVKPEELVVLKREGDEVISSPNVPDFRGYSIEDIVADDLLFDSPVFSPELEENLETYHKLAAVPAAERSSDDTKTLQDLAQSVRQWKENDSDDAVIQELRKIQEQYK